MKNYWRSEEGQSKERTNEAIDRWSDGEGDKSDNQQENKWRGVAARRGERNCWTMKRIELERTAAHSWRSVRSPTMMAQRKSARLTYVHPLPSTMECHLWKIQLSIESTLWIKCASARWKEYLLEISLKIVELQMHWRSTDFYQMLFANSWTVRKVLWER